MSISIDIPKIDEDALRSRWGDLERAAKEALVIESYRGGKLSLGDAARILGMDTSIEAQTWLARRGVALNYDLDELDADRKTLANLQQR